VGALSSQHGKIRTATRVAKMALWRSVGRSDYARWSDVDSLETWWESRTQKLAQMIPDGTRVLEFGAGRRRLARFLGPHCTYMASDLVDRGGDTFVCDLNRRPLPELGPLRPQVAVFAGVLEYVRDVPAVVSWLAPQVSYCVASYVSVHRAGLWNRLAVSASRTYYGYMNSYSEAELIEVFSRHRFRCVRTESWNDQRLFLFETWHMETRP
jgi:hypothetical protein